MFPMPALPRKMAGAFVMLVCAASAGPVASGRAQSTVDIAANSAANPPPAGTPQPVTQQAGPATPQAGPDGRKPATPSPAAIPLVAAKPLATPAAPNQGKAAAAKPVAKSIPKPGPGTNDAGQAATALRTVKLSLVGLIDRSVIGREKREIGHVIDVLVDAKGQPAALVVDVGGFMGVGNRNIAIAWERFALAGRKPKDALQLPLSDAQVKAAPAYDGSENVTVVQDAIEPPVTKALHPATGRSSLNSSRVDLGEGLASPSDQAPDPLNPD